MIRFDSGQVVELRAETGALRITASVPDDADPDGFAQVVAEHLQRFGKRDELVVTWD